MAEDTFDVAHVAQLARLNLSQEEKQLFQEQLARVLHYADQLCAVAVGDVEVAAHAVPLLDVFREDVPRDWFDAEQALGNAPRQADGLFMVTKVMK